MVILISLVYQPLHMPGVNGVIESLAEVGVSLIIIRRRVGNDNEVVIYKPVGRFVLSNNDWTRVIAQVTEYYDCKVLMGAGKDQVLECHPA